ncbi:MAG TPA: hypothetical protein VFH38_12220 [Jatrophihabitans sp.]|nr:hypothetical protein [Jatrophihabitans sp.]
MASVPPSLSSTAQVTEQMVEEFGPLLSPAVVEQVVSTVSDHLGQAGGAAASPEALARAAHARLNTLRLELLT